MFSIRKKFVTLCQLWKWFCMFRKLCKPPSRKSYQNLIICKENICGGVSLQSNHFFFAVGSNFIAQLCGRKNNKQQAKSKEQRTKSNKQRVKSKKQRAKSKKQRAKSNEQQANSNDQRTKSSEQRANSNEQWAKGNEQRAKINEQRAKINEQWAKNNEQRAKSNEQRAESNELKVQPLMCIMYTKWNTDFGVTLNKRHVWNLETP